MSLGLRAEIGGKGADPRPQEVTHSLGGHEEGLAPQVSQHACRAGSWQLADFRSRSTGCFIHRYSVQKFRVFLLPPVDLICSAEIVSTRDLQIGVFPNTRRLRRSLEVVGR